MDSDYEFGFVDLHLEGKTIRLDAANHFMKLLPEDMTAGIQSMDSTLYAKDGAFVARIKMPIIFWH